MSFSEKNLFIRLITFIGHSVYLEFTDKNLLMRVILLEGLTEKSQLLENQTSLYAI